MRRSLQAFEVVHREWAVIQLDRGEQRTVRAERAVRRHMHKRCPVDRLQYCVRRRAAVREHDSIWVQLGKPPYLLPAGRQVRSADQYDSVYARRLRPHRAYPRRG